DARSHDFIFGPYGHGWHLDRVSFDASLRQSVEDRGISVLTGSVGDRIVRTRQNTWRIPLRRALDGSAELVLTARWLIDCSGRGSHVASRLGARIAGNDRLVALAALSRSEDDRDSDCSTLIEAAPDGWWYTARLTKGRRVAVFHTDGDLPVCQIARRHEGFLRFLDQTTHIKARTRGYVVPEDGPVALAAGGRWLERAIGDGWTAVGDAAQSYDPLSSQGLVHA